MVARTKMKIGRNDPCPCKSGRKYKKCHGQSQNSPLTSASVMLPRHEVWRNQYRQRRYLEFLNKDDLIQRAKDVLANTTLLNEELKISFHPVGPEGEYWWRRFTDILEEFTLRKYEYDHVAEQIAEAQIPKYDSPNLQRAVNFLDSKKLNPGPF